MAANPSLPAAVRQNRRRLPLQRRPPAALRLTVALIAALMALPLVYLLLRAVQAGPQAIELIQRPRTLQVLFNSAWLAVTVTVIAITLGAPLAWLTVRTDLPGRKVWSVLTVMPLVIPSYVGGFALVAFMGPRGMLQEWLAPLGVERLPEIYGFPGAVWALSLFTYPYVTLSVRAGLHRLDPSLLEAARSLGYGPWQSFWRVILPALRPHLAAGALLVALYTLSDFGAVSLLRFNSFTRAIFLQYRGSFDRSQAALLALMLVLLTITLLLAERRLQGRARYYRLSVGVARQARPLPLGKWRLPALLFCAGVTLAALVIPIGVILIWLERGLLAGINALDLASLNRAALGSIQAAALAAVAAVVCALPVAYLAVRFPSRFSIAAERAAYLGFGLPGIVVALSLVFFGANYAPGLYQTLPLLIFAYVVLFLPQAIGAVRAGLLQASPRLEEAGRGLGLTWPAVWRRITLPLLRPGLLSGVALVFLTTLKELPATLLLAPTGFRTLAGEIWAAADEAFFARAALPALVLVAISALSIFMLLSQEES